MAQLEKKQQPIMNRRTFLKRGSWLAMSFLATCSLPFYSYFAEPRWMETVELELGFPRLPSAFDGVRILHFSDVHYGFNYDLEQLTKLISSINDIQPDMIVFTGDFFDGEIVPYIEECKEALSYLFPAPLGIYTVMGNHDYYTGYSSGMNVIEMYMAAGIKVLRNNSMVINREGQTIQIAGIDDMFLGRPNIQHTFVNVDRSKFTLFLAHEAEFADHTTDYSYDLQLSGHSHGGQVRFPLIGAVLTPPGGGKYVQGLHTLNNRNETKKIYTNRGIGTTRIPIRFLCRPEITVITLRKQE